MPRPYTIQILVPDGDPNGLKKINKLNWSGLCLVFPRYSWPTICVLPEFKQISIYILWGYATDEDQNDGMPTIYIGQTSSLFERMNNHDQKKEFWQYAACFVSESGSLMQSDVLWIEYRLVQLAKQYQRARIANTQQPKEPNLSSFQKAGTQAFLEDMLQILPLIQVNAFNEPRDIHYPFSHKNDPIPHVQLDDALDTLVIPAKEEGFKRVFLGENRWYAVRISGNKINQIRYIAAYQTKPKAAITHFAKVARIEPYGDGKKYQVIFSEPAQKIPYIHYADAPSGSMQGARYTSFERLIKATKIMDLF